MSSSKVTLKEPSHHGQRLVFGSMTLGGRVNEEDSRKQLNIYFDFHDPSDYVEIDSAHFYGNGQTEEYLGKLTTAEQKKRWRMATKANPLEGGLGYDSVVKQLNESLARLQVDRVDIFYLHFPDPNVELKESLRAVNDLYKQNKFVEFGISNYSAAEVKDILAICESESYIKPTVYQGIYNALTRSVEGELFDVLHQHKIRFYAYSPLAGGFLTGKFGKYEDQPLEGTRFASENLGGKLSRDRFWKPEFFSALDLIRAAIKQHIPDKSLTEVSLLWMHYHSQLRRENFDGIIIGQTNFEHLDLNLKTGTGSSQGLPAEVVAAMDKAWTLVKDVAPNYRHFVKEAPKDNSV